MFRGEKDHLWPQTEMCEHFQGSLRTGIKKTIIMYVRPHQFTDT